MEENSCRTWEINSGYEYFTYLGQYLMDGSSDSWFLESLLSFRATPRP
jgi:hypothetical protein